MSRRDSPGLRSNGVVIKASYLLWIVGLSLVSGMSAQGNGVPGDLSKPVHWLPVGTPTSS